LASSLISSEKVAENSRFWRLFRHQRDDLLDVADEAHVEHAVGFVQHQDFHAGQVHGLLATWSSRRPGVATRMSTRPRRAAYCGIDVDAAEHHHRFERHVLAVGAHRFFHLGREFARRHQDQARGGRPFLA
jgi:hypothetical protein